MKSITEVKYFIDKKTGCHIPKRQSGVWHESRSGDNGYIMLSIGNKRVSAHRESYMHYKGAIPKGMIVMHSCDNRECINPKHLSIGTMSDNTQDMINKGRHVSGGRKKLTSKQVEEIKQSELSSYKLSEIYLVSSTHIRRIKNGTRRNPNHKQIQYTNHIKHTKHNKQPKSIAVEIDY